MRTDLLGRIADARAAMMLRGFDGASLILVLGPGTREALEQNVAPWLPWDDPDAPEDQRELIGMQVMEAAHLEGFMIFSIDMQNHTLNLENHHLR